MMLLEGWPRFLGFPRQQLVSSYDDAVPLIQQNNGTAPCFASHNWFPKIENNVPKTVMYEWCVFDFDSDVLNESLDDARKLLAFALQENLPYIVRFSGSKGFHVYLRFIPKHILLDPASSRVVAALQNWVIDQTGVKTADIHIIGDLRRVMRIPQTAWAKEVNSAIKVNGLHCITLTAHELLTLTDTEIVELATEPRPTPVAAMPAPPTIAFTDFVKSKAFDIDKFSRRHAATAPHAFLAYSQVSEPLLLELTKKPCVVSALCSTHPSHITKFHLVARLNMLGFPASWVEGLVGDLAQRYSWDVYDVGTTHEQVESIYRHGYKFPSCSAIKAKGGCMGSSCSNFREVCA